MVDNTNHHTNFMQLKNIKALKDKMTQEQKRKLLIGLRKLKEEYTGNIGGETDITNADNLQVNEDEFTTRVGPETNVIAKTFDTEADFDSYVNQRRGIEITSQEVQSLVSELAGQPEDSGGETEVTVDDTIRITKTITFVDENEGANILADLLIKLELQDQKPTETTRYYIKYETTDDFGNNNTTVIKKLKEGNQFCWTAFSKYERAEEEGNPESNSEEEPSL
jgi:hypothetical protein